MPFSPQLARARSGLDAAHLALALTAVAEPSDKRSPMSIATAWASRIMTVSLEMVLPGLAGLWLDGKLGTQLVFMLLGFAVGATMAFWHLLRMTKQDDGRPGQSRPGKGE